MPTAAAKIQNALRREIITVLVVSAMSTSIGSREY
jgi:hypothetical protein